MHCMYTSIYLTDVIGEGHIEPLCVVAVELVGLGEHGDDSEDQVLSHVAASLRGKSVPKREELNTIVHR